MTISTAQLVHEKRDDLLKKLKDKWGTVDEVDHELLVKQVALGQARADLPSRPNISGLFSKMNPYAEMANLHGQMLSVRCNDEDGSFEATWDERDTDE